MVDEKRVLPPGDIRAMNPKAGPFMIQVRFLANTVNDDVQMQIVAPDVATKKMVGEMLRLAADMADPAPIIVNDNLMKHRKNYVAHFLKFIGSTMSAPPTSKIN